MGIDALSHVQCECLNNLNVPNIDQSYAPLLVISNCTVIWIIPNVSLLVHVLLAFGGPLIDICFDKDYLLNSEVKSTKKKTIEEKVEKRKRSCDCVVKDDLGVCKRVWSIHLLVTLDLTSVLGPLCFQHLIKILFFFENTSNNFYFFLLRKGILVVFSTERIYSFPK